MKKICVLCLMLFTFFAAAATAQEAEKIDTFGEIQCEDLRSRLDNFLVQLRNQPSAKGFIVVYDGTYSRPVYKSNGKTEYKDYPPAVGEAKYRTQVMMNHLKLRNFPVERISPIDGGFRENYTVEFWIVPTGAELPKPTPTLDKIKYRKGKPAKIVCET